MAGVCRISITPIKGTALHHPGQIELGPNGVAENRLFHLVDAHGLMANGKRFGSLVQVRADYDGRSRILSLQTPDGKSFTEAVHLTGEQAETSFYGRPVRGTVVGGRLAGFLSDHVGATLRLVQVDTPGAAVDVHPVTLISTATMDHIREGAGGPADGWPNRFRILLELDGLPAFGEEAWESRTLAIGAAVVSVVGPVPRCVVTAQNPHTGVQDFDTLAALRRLRGAPGRTLSTPTAHLPDGGRLMLGVYATVTTPGIVRRGDAVHVVE